MTELDRNRLEKVVAGRSESSNIQHFHEGDEVYYLVLGDSYKGKVVKVEYDSLTNVYTYYVLCPKLDTIKAFAASDSELRKSPIVI